MDNEERQIDENSNGASTELGNKVKEGIDNARTKRAETNANNTQVVRVASSKLKKTAIPVASVIARIIDTGDRFSGGKFSEKVGRDTSKILRRSGPLGWKAQRDINKATNKLNSITNKFSHDSKKEKDNKNKAPKENSEKNQQGASANNNQESTSSTSNNETSKSGNKPKDEKVNGTITQKKTTNLKLIAIIVIIVLSLFLFMVIVSTIVGGYENSGTDNGSGSVQANQVNGVGSYFLSSEDSNFLNSSIVYVKENGENVTYTINEFLIGGVYNLTGDNYSEELYKVYAISLRTNILLDEDGVIKSSQYQYTEVTDSNTLTNIKNAITSTENELLLSGNNYLLETDFSNNNCEECDLDDEINLNAVIALINNNYNYEEIIQEIYGENVTVNDINPISSIDLDIDISVKVTTNNNFLHTPIDNFLQSQGSSLNNLNDFIKNNVQPKYGTREGVVIAAVSLINYLYDGYNVKLPYYWGGKHLAEGVSTNFGVYKEPPHISRGGSKFYYISFDCSGFVQWAIYNGGFKDPGTGTSNLHSKYSKYGCKLTNSNCIGEPGDLINAPNNHVQLIVSVDSNNGLYYIAESSGKHGVTISTRGIHSDKGNVYYILHMGEFYRNNRR